MDVSRRDFLAGAALGGIALAGAGCLSAEGGAAAAADAVRCSVDFGAKAGAKVKPLNGTNLGPIMTGRGIENSGAAFKRLNFKSVRLHDAPLDNAGVKMVDVQHIFPVYNPKADPRDEANYFFEATDDYITAIRENSSAEIIYRLGTSIEHSEPRKYFAKEPVDHARYAEICAAIVRRYQSSVTFWEIWNEPNLIPQMWEKTDFNTYISFYIDIAKRLRQEFPAIKIGGPALTNADKQKCKAFIEACRAKGAPLDFFSWHGYCKDPMEGAGDSIFLRKALDDNGFKNAILDFNEWHYFPCTWDDLTNAEGRRRWTDTPDGINGIDSAAFITLCLTKWQDLPLDRSNFYATNLRTWGLYDLFGATRPTYWSLAVFGDFMRSLPERVKTEGSKAVALLGGIGEDGKQELLVTSFKPAKAAPIAVKLAGVPASGTATVTQLDSRNKLEKTKRRYADSQLVLPAVETSAVFLVQF